MRQLSLRRQLCIIMMLAQVLALSYFVVDDDDDNRVIVMWIQIIFNLQSSGNGFNIEERREGKEEI